MIDINMLIKIGAGFAFFIMIIAVFFSATSTVVQNSPISNTKLNTTFDTVLDASSTVFKNINSAWQIGAIAIVIVVILTLYLMYTRGTK